MRKERGRKLPFEREKMGRWPSVRTHIDAKGCGAKDGDKSDSSQLRSGHGRGGPMRKRRHGSGGGSNFEPAANEEGAKWRPQTPNGQNGGGY